MEQSTGGAIPKTFCRNVLLLKNTNFRRINGQACMPTASELSTIKKTVQLGQFKKDVIFEASMSEDGIKKKLEETFPYLENKRFSCAAVVKLDKDSSKFEFHGSPRPWSGNTIRSKIKGNSALYILEDEEDHLSDCGNLNEVTANPSDSGFDEAISDDLFSMISCDFLTDDDPFACQTFGFSKEELDSELCAVWLGNDDLLAGNIVATVQDICPSEGSVEGGMKFNITLAAGLSEDNTTARAHFIGIADDIPLEKLNPYTLCGIIPRSQQPGRVQVTVNTPAGQMPGMTYFTYVDDTREFVKKLLVKGPAQQSHFLAVWSQELNSGSHSNIAQDNGSLIQTKEAQLLKVLQLLVYTAAQTDAPQIIQMIFSTSAGKIVFNTYKDRTPLPEDVARANGHDDLAQCLQDVNIRLSKESSSDVQSNTIDWLELVKAVDEIQKQSSVTENETDCKSGQSKGDHNQSDYFADDETSSCGSFKLEDVEGEDGEETCTKDGGFKKEPSERLTSSLEGASIEVSPETGTQLAQNLEMTKGDDSYEEPSIIDSKHSLSLDCLYEDLLPSAGDDSTARQQGVDVEETQEMGSFTQRIGGRNQKSDDSNTEQQETNACPSHERTAKPKNNLLILQPDNSYKPDENRGESKSGQPSTLRSSFQEDESVTEQKTADRSLLQNAQSVTEQKTAGNLFGSLTLSCMTFGAEQKTAYSLFSAFINDEQRTANNSSSNIRTARANTESSNSKQEARPKEVPPSSSGRTTKPKGINERYSSSARSSSKNSLRRPSFLGRNRVSTSFGNVRIYVKEITAPVLGRELVRRCGNEGRHRYLDATSYTTLRFLRAAISFIPDALNDGGNMRNAAFMLSQPGREFLIQAGDGDWEYFFSEEANGEIYGRCIRKPFLRYVWDGIKKIVGPKKIVGQIVGPSSISGSVTRIPLTVT